MILLQPIEAGYFRTTYFWVTTAVSIVVSLAAVLMSERGDHP